MRLCFFDEFTLGIVKGDAVVDVSSAVADIPHVQPQELMRGLIEGFATYRPRLEALVASSNGVPLSSVRIRPPLPHPANIACMAVNYMEGRDEPAVIDAFLKSPSAIIGPGDTMVLPDVPAVIFEGEAELAIVISKRASNVLQADAPSYIFGYTNFIDGSARGVGSPLSALYQMKSRDTFAPIGPFIVTADEVGDAQKLPVRLWNNGVLCQDFNTDDMAHKIMRCVEFVTAVHALEAGDLIATGTSHGGLNAFMDGDKVELEIGPLGKLAINVRDDLKRTWGRETRHQMAEKGTPGPTPQLTGKYAQS